MGFYKGKESKLTYNHYDSYPSGLGVDLLNELKETTIEELNNAFDNIVLIDSSKNPTKRQIKECKEFSDLGVSKNKLTDWYCLLRKAQGTLKPYFWDLERI